MGIYFFITVLILISAGYAATKEQETFSKYVGTNGEIKRPTDFKEKWVYLGSWIHPESEKDGFHNVYTQPGVVEDYKSNGNKFPDGAVLVKELRASSKMAMTTGSSVQHATDEVLWFVMVKDEKKRFKNNANWGDGWGWALYYADNPSKNVSTDYKKDCLGCHIPAKQTDYIYIFGYPVLQ